LIEPPTQRIHVFLLVLVLVLVLVPVPVLVLVPVLVSAAMANSLHDEPGPGRQSVLASFAARSRSARRVACRWHKVAQSERRE
jgi:hypothetical protein